MLILCHAFTSGRSSCIEKLHVKCVFCFLSSNTPNTELWYYLSHHTNHSFIFLFWSVEFNDKVASCIRLVLISVINRSERVETSDVILQILDKEMSDRWKITIHLRSIVFNKPVLYQLDRLNNKDHISINFCTIILWSNLNPNPKFLCLLRF